MTRIQSLSQLHILVIMIYTIDMGMIEFESNITISMQNVKKDEN